MIDSARDVEATLAERARMKVYKLQLFTAQTRNCKTVVPEYNVMMRCRRSRGELTDKRSLPRY